MKKKSKVVLITGGSRGIGKALVDYFCERDWRVAACATSAAGLAGSRADFTFVCDVTRVDMVRSGVKQVLEQCGTIDVLINNAGVVDKNPILPESPDEPWHRVIDVNLNGTYYLCKAVLPLLPDGSGRIINIASVLGLKGVPDQPAYCAAKHGVVGLTRSLALYAAPRGITVNAICPGWVETDMARERFAEMGITAEKARRAIPLGRMSLPEEIAALAYFLAGEEAGNITGQALTIDGGALL